MSWILVNVEKETQPHCWHCGAAIKYVCWVSEDGADPIAVGRQCCAKFMSRKDWVAADREIGNRINNLKRVDVARSVLRQQNNGLSKKKVAYKVYYALKGDANLMVREFPEYAAELGYKE